MRVEEPLTAVDKQDGLFTATTPKQSYRARWIVLATGQRGNPRKLGVDGEDQEHVYHRLYSPRHYKDEDILVIGGGNSAIEAALTLSQQNRVVLSYRSAEFSRLFKDNREALDRAVAGGDIRVLFNSNVKNFGTDQALLTVASDGEDEREETVPMQHAFVLVGSEVPVRFLKSLGIKLENEWSGLLLTFVIIPIFVLFNGKRYCSWICGCGGLAETFGDRWRHLAPKGKTAIRWEKMNLSVLVVATLITVIMLVRDVYGIFGDVADWSIAVYRICVDVWLIGILPVTLYPFLGGKAWCRYWCPLAKLMDLMSNLYVKLGISRYHIVCQRSSVEIQLTHHHITVQALDVRHVAIRGSLRKYDRSGNGSCPVQRGLPVVPFRQAPDQCG